MKNTDEHEFFQTSFQKVYITWYDLFRSCQGYLFFICNFCAKHFAGESLQLQNFENEL